jgi:hypothetical protein
MKNKLLNFRVLFFYYQKTHCFQNKLTDSKIRTNYLYTNQNAQHFHFWKYFSSHIVKALWFRSLHLYGKYKNICIYAGQFCTLST